MINYLLPIVATILLATSCQSDVRQSPYVVQFDHPESITRIQLVYRNGDVADLRRGENWSLNDSLKAWQSPVNTLLETLKRMRVRFIPTEASLPTILADLATQSVKVNVFGLNGNPIRSFYIGGVTSDEQGTYYVAEPDGIPLVIEIPGWQGALRSRFVMGLDEWRDRSLFQGDPQMVDKIQVEFPQQPRSGFALLRERGRWQLQSLNSDREAILEPNASLVQNYWLDVQSVGIESYEKPPPDRARILITLPYCRLQLSGPSGTVASWDFFPVDDTGRAERYWIINQNGEWMLAQTRILQKIFISNAYFLQK